MTNLIYDANREGEESVAIDRHTNLLIAVSEAIEKAIEENDAFERGQEFAPMTATEITAAIAWAAAGTLGPRGVSVETFHAALHETDGYWESQHATSEKP